MLSSESSVSGVVLKGVDPDNVGKVTELEKNLKFGSLEELKREVYEDQPGIIRCHSGYLSTWDNDTHGNDAKDEEISCYRNFSFWNV